MQGDRRQIQTAVLGGADSQEPLLLPLEAIELDAFRHRHGDDTFWCGIWLGGCGRQLTTKLYTDRVCHFAHHADAGPRRAPCARRARDVTSADHLYVKAATEQLLAAQELPGRAVCSEPGTAPAGSLVQLHLGNDQALTIHMNTAVTPDWTQDPGRTVIADGVPVDRRTLQRLPYVHRVRCESDGTSRRVLIGTQTARGTQWYRIDQCSLGPAGLITPALTDLPDRPIARPPAVTTPPAPPTAVSGETRALLLRLASARRSQDILSTQKLIKECDALLRRGTIVPVLRETRDAAEQWVREQIKLLEGRREAPKRLARMGKTASRPAATPAPQEQKPDKRQGVYLAELETALHQERFGDVWALLRALSSLPASAPLTQAQKNLVRTAEESVRDGRKLGVLQNQIARRHWLPRNCPACNARSGQECYDDLPGGTRQLRFGGHDERLQPIQDQRKEKVRRRRENPPPPKPMPAWRWEMITCPYCSSPPNVPCKEISSPHRARVARVEKINRKYGLGSATPLA
ncbi:hypothetical protein ACFYXL_33165 [Streptomyces tsukubensis]|uniref:hypothetical protein n=1 Tax=Streptomyces tsukubensis TaxID=83656 RepID=UPI00369E3BE3